MNYHPEFDGELTHEQYRKRQFFEILPEALASRVCEVAPADRFFATDQGWQPLPYKGYALLSMVNEYTLDMSLCGALQELQQIMMDKFSRDDILVPLPADSFHQTIANTFSAERFTQHIVVPGFTERFPFMIRDALEYGRHELCRGPIPLRLIGFALFRTVIGLLADIEDPHDYDRILSIRSTLYGDSALRGVGLSRTRPFIGHITLAYIESVLDEKSRQSLLSILNTLNTTFFSRKLIFPLTYVHLYSYDHLAAFQPVETIPPLHFGQNDAQTHVSV